MNITLNGRAALITGGSKGLGLAIAKMFAESGGHVAIVARGAESLAKAEAEIRAAAPCPAGVLPRAPLHTAHPRPQRAAEGALP